MLAVCHLRAVLSYLNHQPKLCTGVGVLTLLKNSTLVLTPRPLLFTFGFSLLLLSIVLLLLRYYIYGFKGINELIKIKMVLKASVPLTTTPITDNLLNSSAAECTVFAATIADFHCYYSL
jgi:hypothetical protein